MILKLITFAITPLGTSLCLLLLALACGYWRRRLSFACGLLALCWLLLWSLPVVSQGLISTVERQFVPLALDKLTPKPVIVVLGGALSATGFPPAIGQPCNMSAATDRVWYGAELFKAGKAPLILASGGNFIPRAGLTEADCMKLLLEDFGIPPSAVLIENQSRNTRENAEYTSRMLRRMGIEDVLLVTSASHMARAVKAFEGQGLKVVAAPTDFNAVPAGNGFDAFSIIPSAAALDMSGAAFKELVGQWVF